MQHHLFWSAVALAACHGELIPVASDHGPDAAAPDPDAPTTWEGSIAALLGDRGCTSCHGDAGGYSLETYADAVGCGTDDVPNVLPGDAGSALVTFCADGHGGMVPDAAEVVAAWVLAGAPER